MFFDQFAGFSRQIQILADTYQSLEEQILQVERELQLSGLNSLGNSKRYSFSNDLFFDTPYHLTYEGVEMRTRYLLEDLIKAGIIEKD